MVDTPSGKQSVTLAFKRMEMNMTSQPRKRLRVEIHLSTAIVLMFLAGGMVWLNALPSKDWPWEGHGFGWPWFYMEIQSTRHVITARGTLPDGPTETFVYWSELMNDLAVAMVILFVVWYVSEWRIHRRVNKA
jgi:hypothetical protein